nr:rhodanese-like domain-containing protein [Halalkalibacterium ligniniphilum]
MFINGLLVVAILWFVYKQLVPVKGVKDITTSELKTQLNQKDKQFIDVRTPNEYKRNHLKEFKNIPLYELKQRANELSKDQEVVLICQSGMRSRKASQSLKKLGFTHITNVKGGMSAW